MADAHEERILSDLLGTIAADDLRLAPERNLEAGLMQRLTAPTPYRETTWDVARLTRGVLLATAAAALLAIGIMLTRSQTTATRPSSPVAAVALEKGAGGQPAASTRRATPVPRSSPARGLAPRPSRVELARQAAPNQQAEPVAEVISLERVEPVEQIQAAGAPSEIAGFIPLVAVPLALDEPLASFQIVRVQMPRAALGRLLGPPRDLTRVNEPIQADLLLGEDGTARAIRIATDQSIYPWRTR